MGVEHVPLIGLLREDDHVRNPPPTQRLVHPATDVIQNEARAGLPDVLSRTGCPALFDVQREYLHRLASRIAVFSGVKPLHVLLEFRGDFAARHTPVGEEVQHHDSVVELVERNCFFALKFLQRERRNRRRCLSQHRIHPNEDCCKEY